MYTIGVVFDLICHFYKKLTSTIVFSGISLFDFKSESSRIPLSYFITIISFEIRLVFLVSEVLMLTSGAFAKLNFFVF